MLIGRASIENCDSRSRQNRVGKRLNKILWQRSLNTYRLGTDEGGGGVINSVSGQRKVTHLLGEQ